MEPTEHAPPTEEIVNGRRRQGEPAKLERGGVDELKEDEEGLAEECAEN